MKIATLCISALAAMFLFSTSMPFAADAATAKRQRTYDYQHSRGYYPCTSDPKGFCRTRHAK